jgi:RNA polymerase sigma-70 factor, ECF subfamily
MLMRDMSEQDAGPAPAPRRGAVGDAFDQLYQHEPDVERWVRRLAGPSADVEDIVHDVFVIALNRRRDFRGESRLSTWLFGLSDLVVRRRRWRERLRRVLGRRYEEDAEVVAPSSPTPLDQLERVRDVRRLYGALDRVPEKYRTAVIMFDIDGRPADEIAELLGIATNNVWIRVHRGRAKLLAELAPSSGSGRQR